VVGVGIAILVGLGVEEGSSLIVMDGVDKRMGVDSESPALSPHALTVNKIINIHKNFFISYPFSQQNDYNGLFYILFLAVA
jgi:hypothetical protein